MVPGKLINTTPRQKLTYDNHQENRYGYSTTAASRRFCIVLSNKNSPLGYDCCFDEILFVLFYHR